MVNLSPGGFVFISVLMGFLWLVLALDSNPVGSIGFVLILISGFYIYCSNLEEVSSKYTNLRQVNKVILTQDGFIVKYKDKNELKYKTFDKIPKCNKMYLTDEKKTYEIFGSKVYETSENILKCEKDLNIERNKE